MRLADCGHTMYDGATAKRRALNLKLPRPAKSARPVRRKILYRQLARAAQNFKILLKF